MAESHPTPDVVTLADAAIARCVSLACGIRARSEVVRRGAIHDHVLQMRKHVLRVRGNRSPDTPLTWDDLRLMFAGALRLCADHAEGGDHAGG